mmetsp:Transcript_18348/g.58514  ORF Transcript_18348/g.58514 Transcript_18348/m.58514 type:complete len:253 (-) Transcript_18348:1586-2344(-)
MRMSASPATTSTSSNTPRCRSPVMAITGAGRLTSSVCPRPSLPYLPRPQAQISPPVPTMSVCSDAATAALTVTWSCRTMGSSIGSVASDVSPTPSRGSPRPHTYRSPSAVTATVWKAPQLTDTVRRNLRLSTSVGLYWLSTLPWPSRPYQPPPHVNSRPSSITAAVCDTPQAALSTRAPPNCARITCGSSCSSTRRPSPSLPMSSVPHTYSSPASVTATLCDSPPAAMRTRFPCSACSSVGTSSFFFRPVPS